MKKYFTLIFLLPMFLFGQVDLKIDSAFMRIGAGGFYPSGLDYYELYPDTHPPIPISYSVLVSNQGSSDATNVFLEIYVQGTGGGIYYSDSVDLCSGCVDSLNVIGIFNSNGWVQWDNLYFNYTVLSDSTDVNQSDNLHTNYLNQTQSNWDDLEFRRDNGVYVDSIQWDSTFCSNREIGNVFQFVEDDVITGISAQISHDSSQVGSAIIGRLYKLNVADTTWDFISETYTEYIQPNYIGKKMYTYFPNDICLDSMDVFLATMEVQTGQAQWMFSQEVDFRTVYFRDSTCNLKPIVSPRAVSIFPSRDYWLIYCGAPYIGFEEHENNLHFSISPNPSTGVIQLNYSTTINSMNLLQIHDLSGKQIKSIELGSELSGEHKNSIDLSELDKGVYLISLQTGNQIQTERLVIID